MGLAERCIGSWEVTPLTWLFDSSEGGTRSIVLAPDDGSTSCWQFDPRNFACCAEPGLLTVESSHSAARACRSSEAESTGKISRDMQATSSERRQRRTPRALPAIQPATVALRASNSQTRLSSNSIVDSIASEDYLGLLTVHPARPNHSTSFRQ